MRPDGTRRRRVLQTAAGGILTAATAQAVSASTKIDPPAPAGVVESVRYRHGWAHIALAEAGDTDVVRVINPHGQQIAETSVSLGETSASVDLLANGSYVAGRFKVETFQEIGNSLEQVGEGGFSATPALAVVGFKSEFGGWPQLLVENTGSGPVSVLGVRCGGGFPTPGISRAPGGHVPIDPGRTLLIEFHNDKLPPTSTTEESERDQYSGTNTNAEIALDTVGHGVYETTLTLSWSGNTDHRDRGDADPLYFCNTVQGGQSP
jgi:hypothetical protein